MRYDDLRDLLPGFRFDVDTDEDGQEIALEDGEYDDGFQAYDPDARTDARAGLVDDKV